MGQKCDSCGRAITGTPVRTPTRTLCEECGATFQGLAAGLIAGHDNVGQAIATEGWYQRLRKLRAAKREQR
ncbi:hypothetical protein [Frondihabitans australicus]|uniref:Uncharacterized protein n=1 Tax=Frondihabitans australicus TaxID=386892 RepID=A0A495IH21_9MICO|nr:hypothetical protein [Frondihabitans australicus]RKR75059.1 hypothetical protein C8E83_2195 [Frondihabitans australicus]